MSEEEVMELAETLRARLLDVGTKYSNAPLFLTVAQDETWNTIHALARILQRRHSEFDLPGWMRSICANDRGTHHVGC